jgi:hypothetical protein
VDPLAAGAAVAGCTVIDRVIASIRDPSETDECIGDQAITRARGSRTTATPPGCRNIGAVWRV